METEVRIQAREEVAWKDKVVVEVLRSQNIQDLF